MGNACASPFWTTPRTISSSSSQVGSPAGTMAGSSSTGKRELGLALRPAGSNKVPELSGSPVVEIGGESGLARDAGAVSMDRPRFAWACAEDPWFSAIGATRLALPELMSPGGAPATALQAVKTTPRTKKNNPASVSLKIIRCACRCIAPLVFKLDDRSPGPHFQARNPR